jgi:hypothetical protein
MVAVFSNSSIIYKGSYTGYRSSSSINYYSFCEIPLAELVEYLYKNYPQYYYLIKYNLVVYTNNKSSTWKYKNISTSITPLKKILSSTFVASTAFSTPLSIDK